VPEATRFVQCGKPGLGGIFSLADIIVSENSVKIGELQEIIHRKFSN